MAFCLSEHAWTASDLDSSTKMVFISLCRRAKINTLQCWPSISTIAADCSLSERTVRDCIKKLADKSKPYITY
ncbi:MAG: helix-turn-helix domain-containing protein, partial [Giesbergeria sp.]|uniref:helix-turn-helix domain-containing protein n=1 Tax=Giesbergeria sp. TaxID=2818473 RepID=UPI002A5C15DF|nr:helix-turn-helix domain-containing protein [Giesbergeria sp.]